MKIKVKTMDIIMLICAVSALRGSGLLNYIILGGCAIYLACRIGDWREDK